MSDIPIHNETNYDLTASILDQIERDAVEYFGNSVNAIRVQYGIARHAFNARTGEVRYSFSPSDYGLVDTTAVPFPEPYPHATNIPRVDDDRDNVVTADFDEADGDDEDDEPTTGGMEDELDVVADDDGPEFQSPDSNFGTTDDTERNFLCDDDYS